jgi:iron complex transport system ATP-binding protein
MILLENVTFRREDRLILDNVNIRMNQCENWVVLGRNGSGKTTILEIMNGYQFPTSGGVEVLGDRLGQVDVREMRKKIGYISQSLFEKLTPRDPVWEVVATGEYGFLRFYQEIPDDVIAKAREALRRVRLEKVADQPLGTLSQGERKKVMLARSLMAEPQLMIMDEPCAGLDLYEREQLLLVIGDLAKSGIAIVYVTHHIEEIIPVFTHVALLENGRIIAAGEKRDVLTAEHLQKAYDVPVVVDWSHERPWIRVTADQ